MEALFSSAVNEKQTFQVKTSCSWAPSGSSGAVGGLLTLSVQIFACLSADSTQRLFRLFHLLEPDGLQINFSQDQLPHLHEYSLFTCRWSHTRLFVLAALLVLKWLRASLHKQRQWFNLTAVISAAQCAHDLITKAEGVEKQTGIFFSLYYPVMGC